MRIAGIALVLCFSLAFTKCSGTQSLETVETDNSSILQAFEKHESNVQVRGGGSVSRILTDDNSGLKHQRFIVRLVSGQTVLIDHNIDLAPRVADIKVGDRIEFSGEYVWNEQGGLIHWTHRDPKGNHTAGWLRHNNVIYQ